MMKNGQKEMMNELWISILNINVVKILMSKVKDYVEEMLYLLENQ